MVIKSSREKIDRRESGGSEEGEGKEGEMGGGQAEKQSSISDILKMWSLYQLHQYYQVTCYNGK